MGHPGRPRKHDPVADEIRWHIQNGDDKIVQKLVEQCGIDVPNGDACTPLIWAAFFNRTELLRWLLDRNANVNHQDRTGYCALHFVSQEKHENIAKVLLDAGASTELRDIHGNTPLWTAIFNARGDFRVVQLLIDHGASLDNMNNVGKTNRDLAMTLCANELPNLIRK